LNGWALGLVGLGFKKIHAGVPKEKKKAKLKK